MSATVAFACTWARTPEMTWSGTPWRLSETARLTGVMDRNLPTSEVLCAGVRRRGGR